MPPTPDETAAPDPLEGVHAWRRRTAAGAILTGVALGLRQALEPPAEERQVVVDASGDPPGPPQPVELHFDPAGPAHSWVVLRPWLVEDRQ
jgi:hypothetical protein